MNERDQIARILDQTSSDAKVVIKLALSVEEEYLHLKSPRALGERIAEEVRKAIK